MKLNPDYERELACALHLAEGGLDRMQAMLEQHNAGLPASSPRAKLWAEEKAEARQKLTELREALVTQTFSLRGRFR